MWNRKRDIFRSAILKMYFFLQHLWEPVDQTFTTALPRQEKSFPASFPMNFAAICRTLWEICHYLWDASVLYGNLQLCTSAARRPRRDIFHMVWFKQSASRGDRKRPCLFQLAGNDVLLHIHGVLKSAGQSGAPFMSYRSRVIRKEEKRTSSRRKLAGQTGKKVREDTNHNKYCLFLRSSYTVSSLFFLLFTKFSYPDSQQAEEQILQLMGCIPEFQANGMTESHAK